MRKPLLLVCIMLTLLGACDSGRRYVLQPVTVDRPEDKPDSCGTDTCKVHFCRGSRCCKEK